MFSHVNGSFAEQFSIQISASVQFLCFSTHASGRFAGFRTASVVVFSHCLPPCLYSVLSPVLLWFQSLCILDTHAFFANCGTMFAPSPPHNPPPIFFQLQWRHICGIIDQCLMIGHSGHDTDSYQTVCCVCALSRMKKKLKYIPQLLSVQQDVLNWCSKSNSQHQCLRT